MRTSDKRTSVSTFAHALSDRKGVRAIIPGDVAHSELVRRISSSDPDYRMPPPRSNRTLGPREIALLTKWVQQGAEYEPHWAYVPVHRPVLSSPCRTRAGSKTRSISSSSLSSKSGT